MSDELTEAWRSAYRMFYTPQRRPTPQDRPEPQAAMMAWLRNLGLRSCPPFPFGVCDADAIFWVTSEGQRVPVFLLEVTPGGGGEEARKARLRLRHKQLSVLLKLKLPLFVVEFAGPEDIRVLRYRGPLDYQEEFSGSLRGLDRFLVERLQRAYEFYERRLRQRP
jgi:hypothetical protein